MHCTRKRPSDAGFSAGDPPEQRGDCRWQAGCAPARVLADPGRGFADHAGPEPVGWCERLAHPHGLRRHRLDGILSGGILALVLGHGSRQPPCRGACSLELHCLVQRAFLHRDCVPSPGVSLPGWLRAANAWVLASGPASLLIKGPSLTAGTVLIDSVARMCKFQAVGAAICLIGAIIRLRPAYQASASGEAGDTVRRIESFLT